jgi:hypothetical protein
LKPQNSKLWYETVGDWCDRWTKTNAYASTGFEGPAVRVAPRAQTGSPGTKMSDTRMSDTRAGVSRPTEMEEDKPAPEKTEAPPAAVERAPKRGTAAAPAEPAAPVVAPPPAGARENAKEKSAPAGDGHSTFEIAISAPSDEVQVGADARIVITLSNTSDREILFSHRPGTNNPEFSYRIEVRNAAGREVEETAYAREARLRQQTEGRSVDYVQPGMSTAQTAHLARLVNLSRPGRYTVRVSRVDPATHAVVKSNEVTLNVVP